MQQPRNLWYGIAMLVLGLLNIWYCHVGYPNEESVALRDAKKLFENQLITFKQQTDSVFKMMTDRRVTIGEQRAEELFKLPFTVLAYSGDSLMFWNSNTILPTTEVLNSKGEYSLQSWKNGYYILRVIRYQADHRDIRYAFIEPIQYDYATSNEYLKPGYAKDFNVDPHVALATQPFENATAVSLPDGNHFYLTYNQPHTETGTVFRFYILFVTGILALLAGLYTLLFLSLSRLNFSINLLVHVVLLYALHFIFHLLQPVPKEFLQWDIFNPNYYASPYVASSLGLLFMELVAVLYICIRWYQTGIGYKSGSERWYDLLWQSVVLLAAVTVASLLVRSLVLDSSIQFSFFNPFIPDYKNLLAVITIAAVLISLLLLILPITYNLSNSWSGKSLLLLLPVVGLYLLMLWLFQVDVFAIVFIGVVSMCMALLQSTLRVRYILQSSITSLFILLIFEAGSFSLLLHHYNQQKEVDLRLSYARKLVNERDNVTEYLLGEVRAPILTDPTVRAFFEHTSGNAQRLDNWLTQNYFGDGFNRFDVSYHYYDCDGLPLQVNESIDNAMGTKDLISNSVVCGEHELYFINEPAGSFTYIAEYPIRNQGESVVGTLMVQLTSKIYKAVNVYPELLLEEKNKLPASDYAYAIYADNFLTEHAGSFTYPAYNTFILANDNHEGDYHTFDRDQYSHLTFHRDEGKTVVVSLPLQQSSRILSYFSYLFLVLFIGVMLLWLMFFLQAWWQHRAAINFLSTASFRTFIQFSFFLIILMSVLVIGLFTGRFFVNQFNRTTEARLNEKLQMVAESAEFIFRNQKQDTTEIIPTKVLRDNVAGLSSIQDIDINFYSLNGDLITTSQPAIFERGLISRKVSPRALYLLSNQSLSHLVQKEQIGNLTYLSGYQPLRSKDGRTLAYLNLPFFSTTRELNEQIGLFLASLITILVFALIVAGLLAPLISRHITRRLSIITDKFKQVTLGRKNEAIEWHTRDELGSLVEEFNKMIYKLEQSAGLLAKSERESAWREMAKQVAHEIKNPLTPMKLSIQHLQRAYRDNAPNKNELTEKVSVTLIEQIDNLSKIANEFSNFAKMPSPTVELVSLDEVVYASVNLYKETESVEISFTGCDVLPMVNADRSQLLRVFNNLLLNAIQAIPEDKYGAIDVRCDSGERFVRLAIVDNGIGITPEEAERVFVPSFTTKSSGTGLGLAISKNIVEGFGGKMWFESVPGNGTTFFVELPRAK